jgi:hypothetical protein
MTDYGKPCTSSQTNANVPGGISVAACVYGKGKLEAAAVCEFHFSKR